MCVMCICFVAAPCGSRSTGSEGTVLSPNFPKNYTAGHSCVYAISVPREFGTNALLLTSNTIYASFFIVRIILNFLKSFFSVGTTEWGWAERFVWVPPNISVCYCSYKDLWLLVVKLGYRITLHTPNLLLNTVS